MDRLQNKNTPKTINMYNNWKTKEIKKLIQLKEDMIINNIEKKLIDIYMEEEYKKINDIYNMKVDTYYKNQEKMKEKKDNTLTKQKKAINLLIKSKMSLEQFKMNPNYIKMKTDKQYDKIINLNNAQQ
jgi:hypothetical protein